MKIKKTTSGVYEIEDFFTTQKMNSIYKILEELSFIRKSGTDFSYEICAQKNPKNGKKEHLFFEELSTEISIIQRLYEKLFLKKIALIDISILKLSKGDFLKPHIDDHYNLQGVIYLSSHVRNDNGTFVAYCPQGKITISPEYNSCLLFKSDLKHEVVAYNGKNPRYSIIFGFSYIKEAEKKRKILNRKFQEYLDINISEFKNKS